MEKPFAETRASVCIFSTRKVGGTAILYGPKTSGSCKGYFLPPGGKSEAVDSGNPIKTAEREGLEETGLHGMGGVIVARLHITIRGLRQKRLISVVHFSTHSGNLQVCDEFEWLEYLTIPDILSRRLPAGEKDWIPEVLLRHNHSLVEIECGEDRQDLIGKPKITPF